MIDPAIVQLLAGLVQAIPAIASALTPDAKAAIGEHIAAARAALPAPGATSAAVEAVIARHVAALQPRVTHATADVLARIHGVTPEERMALDDAIAAVRSVADARDLPPVIAWSEPGSRED